IDAFDPAARELLARTADILSEEDRFLDQQIAELPDDLAGERAAFARLPPALQRRVIRRLIPDAGFLEVEALRRGEPPASAVPNPQPPARLTVRTCTCDPLAFKARDRVGHLDGDLVQLPLVVATRRPGDRMRPLGLEQAKLLQD